MLQLITRHISESHHHM